MWSISWRTVQNAWKDGTPKKVQYIDRPKKPWFNKYINEQRIVTNRDRIYKKHRGNDHWRAYTIERNKYIRLVKFHRHTITKQIMANSKDTKQLFRIVNNLTGCNTYNPLPPGNTREEIAEGFAEFFSNKITKVQQSFTGTSQYHPIEETNMLKLTNFRPLTDDEVKREIMSMKITDCKLDQISTLTLNEIITVCLPSITHIVNMSLTRGDFITDWKLAMVKPLLKNLAQNLYIETTDLCQTYAFSTN